LDIDGGKNPITTYKEVCTGNTNHAEVVKLDFDEKIITYEQILNTYFSNSRSYYFKFSGTRFWNTV